MALDLASSLVQSLKVEKCGNPMQKARVEVSPGNFVEMFTHDEYGFAIDPKVWASERVRPCCEGRGFNWVKSERTETLTDLKDGQLNAKRYEVRKDHREMRPCSCANLRYQKFREGVEKRLLAAVARGEDPAGELMKIHAEMGHIVKIESKQTGGDEPLIQVVSK